MSRTDDPLTRPLAPDRLHFTTGMLLDAEDFQDEQNYHRSRLARLAAYLHGYGTVAGLEVQWIPARDADGSPAHPPQPEQLVVTPGLAVDRLGRLMEVRRPLCLRLGLWFDQQAADPSGRDKLSNAYHSAAQALPAGVWADVFIAAVPCLLGTRPAFVTGDLDHLDGVAPSRVRDGHHVSLVLREETDPALPRRPFPDLDGIADPTERRERIITYKLREAWVETTLWEDGGPRIRRLPEHGPNQDGTELFLARVVIPAQPGPPVVRDLSQDVVVFNELRMFSFSTAELVWLTGQMR